VHFETLLSVEGSKLARRFGQAPVPGPARGNGRRMLLYNADNNERVGLPSQ